MNRDEWTPERLVAAVGSATFVVLFWLWAFGVIGGK